MGALVAMLAGADALADVTGTVFRDYDGDGTRGSNEPPIANVTVTAYDATGNKAGGITNAAGVYTIAAVDGVPLDLSGAVRVEFTLPLDGSLGFLQPGATGPTSVQFVDSVGTDNPVNVGFANPAEYSGSPLVPKVVTAIHTNGDPTLGGTAASLRALVAFPYNASGTAGAESITLAMQSQVGAVGGIAVQRETGFAFAAALAKRHAGFGPGESGAIYRVTIEPPHTPTLFINLNTALGSTVTGAIDRSGANALPATHNTPNRDPNAWNAVGKVAFGDIDIGEDDQTLWVMSLANRTLYEIVIDSDGDPATAPTAADITSHPILSTHVNCPTGTENDYRPWATKVHDGKVYVGVVCSAESTYSAASPPTSSDRAKLQAVVLVHDPLGTVGNFSELFRAPLDYPRGHVSASAGNIPAEWLPWVPEMSTLASGTTLAFDKQVIYPQPILADIEFDETGAMILGFLDRNGHQTGNANYSASATSLRVVDHLNNYPPVANINPGTRTFEGTAAGDLLRVCPDTNGVYVLESNGKCGGVPSSPAGADNNQGPGNGEFYWQDMYTLSTNKTAGTHHEITLGGLLAIPGRGEVMSNVFDPLTNIVRAGGVGTFYNSGADAGKRYRSYQLFGTDAAGTFGKAAGLADIEVLLDPAPIEIGNRVWKDTNRNGIQDPAEAGMANVLVELWKGSEKVAETTTDADGRYLFSYLGNPNSPTTELWYAPDSEVLAGTAYQVRVLTTQPPLSGWSLTRPNAPQPANGNLPATGNDPIKDIADSDGTLNGGNAIIAYTTGGAGYNNHGLDYGFFSVSCTEICDVVAPFGTMNQADVLQINRMRGKKVTPSAPNSGDCTGDGVISVNDGRACQSYYGTYSYPYIP